MSPKIVLTSSRGRHCKHPACKRVLSVYNHSMYCHAHLIRMFLERPVLEPDHKLQAS